MMSNIKWVKLHSDAFPENGKLYWVVVHTPAGPRAIATKCVVQTRHRTNASYFRFVPLITAFDMTESWPIENKCITHYAEIESPELPGAE